jgi:hypothetical protein
VAYYKFSTNGVMDNTKNIAYIYTSVKPLLQVSILFGFTPFLIVQTGSEVHPTSCPMGTGGSFPGGKAAGA